MTRPHKRSSRTRGPATERGRRLATDLFPASLERVIAKLTEAGQIPPGLVIQFNTFNIVDKRKDKRMRDNIRGNQAAAIGNQAKAKAKTMTFTQGWKKVGGGIDLDALAEQLATLRVAMKKEAADSDDAAQDEAVAAVAKAKDAAKADDGPGVLEHLKRAGKWAFEVAEKVGVDLAADAIKKAMGFGA